MNNIRECYMSAARSLTGEVDGEANMHGHLAGCFKRLHL